MSWFGKSEHDKRYGLRIKSATGETMDVWFHNKDRRNKQYKLIKNRPTKIAFSSKKIKR